MKYEVEVVTGEHEIRKRYVVRGSARRYFNTARTYWGSRGASVVMRDLATGEILGEHHVQSGKAR